jgi:AraC-like DNA-binding protein
MGSRLAQPPRAGIDETGNVAERTVALPGTVRDGRLASAAYRFEVISEAPMVHPAVPELGVTLVASTQGPFTVVQPDGARTTGTLLAFGPSLTPRVVLTGTRMRGTHLTLTPSGTRDLLGVPMAELADRVLDVRELPTTMIISEDHPTGLSGHAHRREPPTEAVEVAWRWWSRLGAMSAPDALDDLAASVGLSPRRVRMLVASEFGLTPKAWQRLARLHHARRLIRSGHSLAHVAAEVGYADQPHLHREWRAFTLQTPAAAKHSEYLPHSGRAIDCFHPVQRQEGDVKTHRHGPFPAEQWAEKSSTSLHDEMLAGIKESAEANGQRHERPQLSIRPAAAPVSRPCSITSSPFTTTWCTPTHIWCGWV